MTNIEYIGELEKDIKKLQGENNRSKEKHKKATLKIKAMKNELLESQNYTNELENNNLVYMSHNLALMVENTELKEKLDTLIEENSCLDEDIDIKNIMEENKKLRKTISELENDYVENDCLDFETFDLNQEISKLELENTKLEDNLNECINDYIQVKNKNQELVIANTHLQAENKNLKEEINCHEDANTWIAKDVAELIKEKEELENGCIDVKVLMEENKLLKIENKDFKEALNFYKNKSKKQTTMLRENNEIFENLKNYLNNMKGGGKID